MVIGHTVIAMPLERLGRHRRYAAPVAVARRADIGTDDGAPGSALRKIAGVVRRPISDIGSDRRMRRLTAAALAREVRLRHL